MLKFLRKKGVMKKVLWVLAVVIIISFGFFGTANYLSRRGSLNITDAGKVFGRTVSFDEFETNLSHARYQAILRYGDNFQKISQFLNLEAEAWDRIILLREARKRKIKISDDEVVKTIQDFGFFKNDGKFNTRIYDDILRYVFRCEPRDFEESVRESLMFAKLYDQETSSIDIPEEKALEEYKNRNEKVQVSYALFSADDYQKDIRVTPEEIKQYYEGHGGEFKMPPSVNVEYLNIPFTEQIQDQEKQAIQEQVDNIYKELKSDPDLIKAGKKYSLESGESGFFSQEEPNLKLGWPFEVLQRVFTLKENETSEPIRTPKGFYILRIKQKKDSYVAELEQATAKITETLTRQKAKDIAKAKADESLKQIGENLQSNPQANFADAAKNLGLKVQQTEPFVRGQYLPTIGVSKDFEEAAFSLNDKKKISGVVETAKGYCILSLDSFVGIDEKKFGEEKQEFLKNLYEEQKAEVFGKFLRDLRASANLRDNISKLKQAQQPNP